MPALTQRSLTSFSQAPRLLVLNEDSYSRPDDELGNQAKPEQCAPPSNPSFSAVDELLAPGYTKLVRLQSAFER